MSTRFQLGISVFAALLASAAVAPAQAAVTVIGGGMARACYEAVEYQKVPGEKAIEVCTMALDQEVLSRRDKAATYTNRGILHMRAGRNQRALWDYQKGIALMPDLYEAKVNLGAALYGLERYTEALAALNEGVLTDSVDARAIGFYNRGLCYEKLGNLQQAYEDFRRALNTNPEFKQAAMQMERFTVVPASQQQTEEKPG